MGRSGTLQQIPPRERAIDEGYSLRAARVRQLYATIDAVRKGDEVQYLGEEQMKHEQRIITPNGRRGWIRSEGCVEAATRRVKGQEAPLIVWESTEGSGKKWGPSGASPLLNTCIGPNVK